jgi:hypothetical protein
LALNTAPLSVSSAAGNPLTSQAAAKLWTTAAAVTLYEGG